MAILFGFRMIMLLVIPLESVIGFGDLRNFFRLAQIPGWPYFQYWSEYPPIFPFFSRLLFLVSGDRESLFIILLFVLLSLADCLNLFMFSRINEKIWPDINVRVRLGVYLIFLLVLPYSWWYFESLVVLTMLSGLWFMLEDKPIKTGLMIGFGILIKTFPVLLLPLTLKKLGWKRGMMAAGIALGMVGLIYALLWMASPEFTRASLQSQGVKGSWETVWAILDGNTQTGIIGPLVERLDPAKAAETTRNPALISPLITLALFGGLGLFALIKSRLSQGYQQAAFLLLTLGIFFLWSPGWSVQWVLYLIPFILLVFSLRQGILLSGMLTIANLLEWPIIYQINPDYVFLTVTLRTILILLTTWMAFQLVSGESKGGFLYTSGRRSENTGR